MLLEVKCRRYSKRTLYKPKTEMALFSLFYASREHLSVVYCCVIKHLTSNSQLCHLRMILTFLLMFPSLIMMEQVNQYNKDLGHLTILPSYQPDSPQDSFDPEHLEKTDDEDDGMEMVGGRGWLHYPVRRVIIR